MRKQLIFLLLGLLLALPSTARAALCTPPLP